MQTGYYDSYTGVTIHLPLSRVRSAGWWLGWGGGGSSRILTEDLFRLLVLVFSKSSFSYIFTHYRTQRNPDQCESILLPQHSSINMAVKLTKLALLGKSFLPKEKGKLRRSVSL